MFLTRLLLTNRVAIIGAGPSGLVAAKYALENNLEPVVFETRNDLGGKWSPSFDAAAWPNLTTNGSRYMQMFSDHPWPPSSRLNPLKEDMYQYLNSYSKRFQLDKCLKLAHQVDNASQSANFKWTLNYTSSSGKQTAESFDFLIVASGIHAKPREFNIKKKGHFKGVCVHSSRFRLNDPLFKDKNVLVIGGSVSGVDIAERLVGHAKSVCHVFNRPPLVLPLVKKTQLAGQGEYSITHGLFDIFNRNVGYLPAEALVANNGELKKKFLRHLSAVQTDPAICPDENLLINTNDGTANLPFVTVNNFYIERVRDKLVRPICAKVDSFWSNGLILADGRELEADVVIHANGYDVNMPYFNSSIRDALKYDASKATFALLLYKFTFPALLANVSFIGQYEGLFFPGFELQAKWSSLVFSGKKQLPGREKMVEYVRELERVREGQSGDQFPYGRPPRMSDVIAAEIGLLPDFEKMKESDPVLYDLLWNNCISALHYLPKQTDSSLAVLKEAAGIKERVYKLRDDAKQADVIEEFSKYNRY